MVNGHAVNGVPRTAPGTSRAPAKTPSPWLTAQCKDIIGKIVEANQKYRVSFDVIHATLIREHPGQTEMIDAIVQAAKIVSSSISRRHAQLKGTHQSCEISGN